MVSASRWSGEGKLSLILERGLIRIMSIRISITIYYASQLAILNISPAQITRDAIWAYLIKSSA